jgi:hypothetical protein
VNYLKVSRNVRVPAFAAGLHQRRVLVVTGTCMRNLEEESKRAEGKEREEEK